MSGTDSKSSLKMDPKMQPQELSSLKQVRDILVGPLSSELDQSVRELGQRLDRSMAEFSETTTKRVAAVEARFQGDFERLQQSIKELTDDVAKATESFRTELKNLRGHVGQRVDSVKSRLEDESRRLRDELVDRTSLSAALSEVALRLAGPIDALHHDDLDRPDIDLDSILDG